jgi:UDP-N-acetylglucosamine 2-epimerase (non-hydrolysing)
MLICFGTRPEYIKVKSLINNLPNIKTCFTGQHKDLLNNVNVDYHIEFKESFSSNRLNDIIIHILKNTYIFDKIDNVIVQGDTTTALAIALSAYNSNIKVIHLEAGLRTNNIYDPFPEELNRQLISRITNIHLCPTINNKKNLLNENIIESKIFVVGNTGLDNITKDDCEYTNKILITLHRRNNLPIIKDWFNVIDNIAFNNPNIEFILPIHPNPEVKKYKNTLKNVNVIEPLSHEDIIKIIKKCKFIISDSGGIQEEACFLNKKIIICRIDTERPEVLENHGVLCKTPDELPSIFNEINNNYIVNAECPFGDGNSYKKIIQIL